MGRRRRRTRRTRRTRRIENFGRHRWGEIGLRLLWLTGVDGWDPQVEGVRRGWRRSSLSIPTDIYVIHNFERLILLIYRIVLPHSSISCQMRVSIIVVSNVCQIPTIYVMGHEFEARSVLHRFGWSFRFIESCFLGQYHFLSIELSVMVESEIFPPLSFWSENTTWVTFSISWAYCLGFNEGYFLKARFLVNWRHPIQSNRNFVHRLSFKSQNIVWATISSCWAHYHRFSEGYFFPLSSSSIKGICHPQISILSKVAFSCHSSFVVCSLEDQADGLDSGNRIRIYSICFNWCFLNSRIMESLRNHFDGKRCLIMYWNSSLSGMAWSLFNWS